MLGTKPKGTLRCLKEGTPVMFTGLKKSFYLSCLLLGFLCLLSSCITTTEQYDFLRQDLNRLRNENVSIKNELNNLKEKTSGIASQDSFNVLRENQAQMQSQLSDAKRDIQLLNGRFEEHKYFVEKSLNDSSGEIEILKSQMVNIENKLKEINERIPSIEARRGSEQAQKPEDIKIPEKPGIEPPDEAHHPLVEKVKKYDDAYNAFKEKRYKEARTKFESFLKEYPQDDLSDNAQFWIAETYYQEKDYENAILSYEIVLKKYKNSEKTPNAFLKQGLCFIELGDKKTGKIILEQVKERYPGTREAELAKKSLDNLKIP